MWGAELFSAFLRPMPLYKKFLLLPMHWTQGALPSEASDYCMVIVCYCMFYYSNTLA